MTHMVTFHPNILCKEGISWVKDIKSFLSYLPKLTNKAHRGEKIKEGSTMAMADNWHKGARKRQKQTNKASI